jgi:probable rRNA maturation factor
MKHNPIIDYTIDIEIDEPFGSLVEADDLVKVVSAALDGQAAPHAEITLVITDDEAIHELNRTYRGVNAPTDVLSFSSQEVALSDGEPVNLPPELAVLLDAHLGDIVIAYPYATRQASRFDNSVAAELRLLAVHGTLHLLGYDHDTPEAEAEMWARQEKILRMFGDQELARRVYSD